MYTEETITKRQSLTAHSENENSRKWILFNRKKISVFTDFSLYWQKIKKNKRKITKMNLIQSKENICVYGFFPILIENYEQIDKMAHKM